MDSGLGSNPDAGVTAARKRMGDEAFDKSTKRVKQEEITLDPNGNLILVVSTEYQTIKFRAFSRTLARMSKYFEAQLYHNFQESMLGHSGGDKVVPMEYEKPEALRLVLCFLHNNDSAPLKNLKDAELYDVVFAIDYLCCEKPFRDIAKTVWESQIRSRMYWYYPQHSCGKTLHVAIYLGLGKLVTEKLNQLQSNVNRLAEYRQNYSESSRSHYTVNIEKNAGLPLTFQNDVRMKFDDSLERFGIASAMKVRRDSIWKMETDTKRKVVDLYRESLTRFFPRDTDLHTRGDTCESIGKSRRKEARLVCHDVISGSFWQQLHKHKLTRESFDFKAYQSKSLYTCTQQLGAIQLVGLECQPKVTTHNNCNPLNNVRAEVKSLCEGFEKEVETHNVFDMPHHLRDFLQRRKKLFEPEK